MAIKAKKLMVYSQDGLGLGHQRRTSRIIEQFLLQNPDSSVLTICDSPLGQVFQSAPNHTYARIPTLVKVDNGVWTSPDRSDYVTVRDMRHEMIADIFNGFPPDVFLVDHMPQGAMGELTPIVKRAKQIGCKLVLGLRDILDDPRIIINRWQKEDAYHLVRKYYDHILIYGQQDIFDARSVYKLPLSVPSTYCGYVSPSRYEFEAPEKSGGRFQKADKNVKSILVTFGGGADAGELTQLVFKALEVMAGQFAMSSIIVSGPFNPLPAADPSQSAHADIKLIRLTDNILAYMKEADLIVAMGGYNTISEILCSETPALIIPRNGPSLEQRMRAGCLKQLGFIDYILTKDLTSETVSEKIVELLFRSVKKAKRGLNLDGAFNAASILNNL